MTRDHATTAEVESGREQPLLGSILLFLGAALFFLALVDASTGLPFAMPRFWYVNRTLWLFVAIGLAVSGTALLRSRSESRRPWRASRPGVRFDTVVLYTREGCHLCDQAKDLLLKHRGYLPELTEVDIDTRTELAERFGTCVPVVEIDGKVRFRGRIDERLLRRLIEGTPPIGQPQ